VGLLFIPQVIYEHGELLLNYIDKGKLLTHPAELSGNPLSAQTSGYKQEEWVKGMRI
jgi:hypothetical protein